MKRGTESLLVIGVGDIATPVAAEFIFKNNPFESSDTLLFYKYPDDENVEYKDNEFYITISGKDSYNLYCDKAYIDVNITTNDGILTAVEPGEISITHTLFPKEEEITNESN